jgi:hypothetical protein
MNSVVFQSAEGVPFATLLMSRPGAPRTCMFIRMPGSDTQVDCREARALQPGRPSLYACDCAKAGDGTRIAFENDDGWRITVSLGAKRAGEWSAVNGGQRLTGPAHAS